ncbi:MAG: hypothetical protein ACYDES_14865, partial [Acidimicrobiales bacterium]
TRHYLHADLGLKQRALERTTPPRTSKGHYVPTDKVLAFLEGLQLCRTTWPDQHPDRPLQATLGMTASSG